MKDIQILKQAKILHKQGLSNRKIAQQLSVHHTTIAYWLKKNFQVTTKSITVIDKNNTNIYSYILGLYLGDGYINKMKRTYKLRIFLDAKYPNIITECINNLQTLFPNNKIHTVNNYHNNNLSYVSIGVYSNQLPNLFPQHGTGKKHQRKITLQPWQTQIINPEKLLRGLFHSDGCYYTQKINNKYEYQYYNFTNFSQDILDIWKIYVESLNIHYTETKHHINHRTKKACDKLFPILGSKT